MNLFTSFHPFNALLPLWLLINRIGISAFMLTHGYPKLMRLLDGNTDGFPDPLGIGSAASLLLAVLTEVAASFLLMLGLFSRFAALGLIVTMAVAVFIVHVNDPFGRMEMALLYLFSYLTIFFFGPGKYALDALIRKR
ncbi:MAG: DoxX family protein [Bacteroidetes bacterium]|jgi:putative oxidoreductase|nr:DoxX family protein [Bacteroidota bacterium]